MVIGLLIQGLPWDYNPSRIVLANKDSLQIQQGKASTSQFGNITKVKDSNFTWPDKFLGKILENKLTTAKSRHL